MGTPRGFPAAGVARPSVGHRGWNKGSYRRGIFIARRERNVNQVLVRLCVKMKRTAEGRKTVEDCRRLAVDRKCCRIKLN